MRIWFQNPLVKVNLFLGSYCHLYRGVIGTVGEDFADIHGNVVWWWLRDPELWAGVVWLGLSLPQGTVLAAVGKQKWGAGAEAIKHESGGRNGLFWYCNSAEAAVCEELCVQTANSLYHSWKCGDSLWSLCFYHHLFSSFQISVLLLISLGFLFCVPSWASAVHGRQSCHLP